MTRYATLALATMALLCFASALPVDDAVAQQMQRVSFKTSAANSKYTQQHVIDVGDVPGHQVRVYELYRAYPNDAPMINGVRLVESWARGYSDYTDTNGPNTGYTVYVMEGGDKFFVRNATVAQNTANPDGSRKAMSTSAGTITGGTGKLANIKGFVRTVNVFDAKAGFNESQTEIEYSVGK